MEPVPKELLPPESAGLLGAPEGEEDVDEPLG